MFMDWMLNAVKLYFLKPSTDWTPSLSSSQQHLYFIQMEKLIVWNFKGTPNTKISLRKKNKVEGNTVPSFKTDFPIKSNKNISELDKDNSHRTLWMS
jgi:hypothetical protein